MGSQNRKRLPAFLMAVITLIMFILPINIMPTPTANAASATAVFTLSDSFYSASIYKQFAVVLTGDISAPSSLPGTGSYNIKGASQTFSGYTTGGMGNKVTYYTTVECYGISIGSPADTSVCSSVTPNGGTYSTNGGGGGFTCSAGDKSGTTTFNISVGLVATTTLSTNYNSLNKSKTITNYGSASFTVTVKNTVQPTSTTTTTVVTTVEPTTTTTSETTTTNSTTTTQKTTTTTKAPTTTTTKAAVTTTTTTTTAAATTTEKKTTTTTVKPTTTTTVTSAPTVANVYKVTFNATGGIGGPSVAYSDAQGKVVIPKSVPSREGYTFRGWSRSVGASSGNIYPNNTIAVDSDVMLFAAWTSNTTTAPTTTATTTTTTATTKATAVTTTTTKATSSRPSYTVYFNTNGGSGSVKSQTEKFGMPITLPSGDSLSRKGHTFVGWSTSKTGSANYSPGDTYTGTGNRTFYAVWKLNENIDTSAEGVITGAVPVNLATFLYAKRETSLYQLGTGAVVCPIPVNGVVGYVSVSGQYIQATYQGKVGYINMADFSGEPVEVSVSGTLMFTNSAVYPFTYKSAGTASTSLPQYSKVYKTGNFGTYAKITIPGIDGTWYIPESKLSIAIYTTGSVPLFATAKCDSPVTNIPANTALVYLGSESAHINGKTERISNVVYITPSGRGVVGYIFESTTTDEEISYPSIAPGFISDPDLTPSELANVVNFIDTYYPEDMWNQFVEDGWTLYVTSQSFDELAAKYGLSSSVIGFTVYSEKVIYLPADTGSFNGAAIHEFGHYIHRTQLTRNESDAVARYYYAYLESGDPAKLGTHCTSSAGEFFAETYERVIQGKTNGLDPEYVEFLQGLDIL